MDDGGSGAMAAGCIRGGAGGAGGGGDASVHLPILVPPSSHQARRVHSSAGPPVQPRPCPEPVFQSKRRACSAFQAAASLESAPTQARAQPGIRRPSPGLQPMDSAEAVRGVSVETTRPGRRPSAVYAVALTALTAQRRGWSAAPSMIYHVI